jgi:hypothetical protein
VPSKRLATALAASVLCLAPAATAPAQPSRVFASARSGSDTNDCSNIQTPCQSLQGAVSQVGAGGSVLVLDTGGYGPVFINKAVTIEAPEGVQAFVHPPSGDAVRVGAGASDVVVLRGLTLSGGSANGILFIAGAALHVERCVIQGFHDGIVAASSAIVSDLYVEDTIVRNCVMDGIAVYTLTGMLRSSIERSTLVANGGYGFGCRDHSSESRNVVRGSLASGNHVGLSCSLFNGGTGSLVIDQSASVGNLLIGVQAGATNGAISTVRLSDSVVTANGNSSSTSYGGISQSGTSQLLSRVNNTIEGNSLDLLGTIGTYVPR